MNIVRKGKAIEVTLNLEEFLEGRFSKKDVSLDLRTRDLGMAQKYYAVLSEMKKSAKDLNWFWDFASGEGFSGDCIIVDSEGVARKREIEFREIERFSDYISEEYGL